MTTRITQSIVRFPSPFWLAGFARQQPEGEYRVDQEEELIEGLSWIAWRRIRAFIYLPAVGIRTSTQHMVPIDPTEFDAMVRKEKDQ